MRYKINLFTLLLIIPHLYAGFEKQENNEKSFDTIQASQYQFQNVQLLNVSQEDKQNIKQSSTSFCPHQLRDVLTDIRSEWLEPRDYIALLTACVKSNRRFNVPIPKSFASKSNHHILDDVKNMPFNYLEVPESITASELLPFIRNYAAIEKLSLKNCTRLSRTSIIDALKMLPNLKYINLSGCNQLTDKGIKAVLSYLRNLTSLDLCGYDYTTVEVIRIIAENCQNLVSLFLSGSWGNTKEDINSIKPYFQSSILLYLGIYGQEVCFNGKNQNEHAKKKVRI